MRNLPVHRRHCSAELVLGFLSLYELDVRVDTTSLLGGGDSPAHPRRTAGEFVIRGEDWPIQGILQRDEAKNSADGLALQKRRGKDRAIGGDMPVRSISPVDSIRLFYDLRSP